MRKFINFNIIVYIFLIYTIKSKYIKVYIDCVLKNSQEPVMEEFVFLISFSRFFKLNFIKF